MSSSLSQNLISKPTSGITTGISQSIASIETNATLAPNGVTLASGIVVSQTSRVISLIGVRDIVVVDTEDALLVTTSENAQRVKGVVDALKLSGRGDVL